MGAIIIFILFVAAIIIASSLKRGLPRNEDSSSFYNPAMMDPGTHEDYGQDSGNDGQESGTDVSSDDFGGSDGGGADSGSSDSGGGSSD